MPTIRSSFKAASELGQAQFAPRTAHGYRGDGAGSVPGGFETAQTRIGLDLRSAAERALWERAYSTLRNEQVVVRPASSAQ
jgi:hypothetical protein